MSIYTSTDNKYANTKAWIGRSCNPSDKRKLTPLPHFILCQQNLNNVSNMLKFEELPEINSERWLSLEDLPGEEWRDVVGFEDALQISCYGRLKRKERLSFNPHNNGYCRYKEKIYRNQSTKLNYQHICICVGNNVKVNLSYHKMVMEAFVPNPNKLPFINHKDENPQNNCVYNLEWCTPEYNSNYGTVNERRRQDKIDKGLSKKVVLYDYEGNVRKEYETITSAALDNNISKALVAQCCDGRVSTANGLHFRLQGDTYEKRKLKFARYCFKVYKEGKMIFTANRMKEISDNLGIALYGLRNLMKRKSHYCKSLEPYFISITSSDGSEYYIENGRLFLKSATVVSEKISA